MKAPKLTRQSGFTMIEAMIALLLLTLITGAVFSQINVAQQRNSSEQTKLDTFQETRDFMDQMTRDLHQAGYPNIHNFGPGTITPNLATVAVGLVKVDNNQLWFEGDVEGTGTVSSVQYHLESTGPDCPCLRRSQIAKVTGNPLTGQGSEAFETEVQHVTNGTSTSPVFYAFDANDNPVTLPVDFNNNPGTIAQITTIKVMVSAESPVPDPKTGQKPSVTMVSTVKLNNCSMAKSGQPMSCQ